MSIRSFWGTGFVAANVLADKRMDFWFHNLVERESFISYLVCVKFVSVECIKGKMYGGMRISYGIWPYGRDQGSLP